MLWVGINLGFPMGCLNSPQYQLKFNCLLQWKPSQLSVIANTWKKKKNRRSGGCHDYDWVGSGFTKHRHPPRAAKVFWIPRRRESICPHHDENITCAKSGFGLSSVLCSLGWWKFRGNCGFGIGFVGFFFRKTGNRN